MLIFGINTLCSILSNCTSKKKSGIKNFIFLMYFIVLSISYVFLCFFDLLFLFCFFLRKFCRKHFLKHNNGKKKKKISAIESKNKHIYMNKVKKLNLH